MKNLDLGELRGQLDEIDGQLVRLFEQRMNCLLYTSAA